MAAGSGHGAQAIGMKESEARTDEAAGPAVAETAASGAKTVVTALLADPVPDTTTQPPVAPHGNTGARVAAAKEAATAETSVAAMAATIPLANEAEATAGEVAAAAEGSAATPAKAATATISPPRYNPRVFFFQWLTHVRTKNVASCSQTLILKCCK